MASTGDLCNTKRFQLVTTEGTNEMQLMDSGKKIDLVGNRFYEEKSPTAIVFISPRGRSQVIEVPKYSAIHRPESNQFVLKYVTNEDSGSCTINALREEDRQAQEHHR